METVESQHAYKHRYLLGSLSALILVFVIGLVLAAGEFIARRLEPKGFSDLTNVSDPRLGWLPTPGRFRSKTAEFDTTISINFLNMNDRELDAPLLGDGRRILAVGDSHTFAVGASTAETWPKRTERLLFDAPKDGSIWNAGVVGYSLGQYLERYRALRAHVKPSVVIIGFSMATDLYDLLPPARGGFIYGGNAARAYFDLDAQGSLLEQFHVERPATSRLSTDTRDAAQKLRGSLEGLALYRSMKRSSLAMTIATYYRPGGKSLWPGLDTALKIDLDEDDKYRWTLAERILERFVQEARADGVKVILVNIPYLAQVYDSVWSASFGRRPQVYDRAIASRRLAQICGRIDAEFIDTTDAFITAARARQRWLHWPQDAHPTPEGHQLIAEVVAAAIKNRRLLER